MGSTFRIFFPIDPGKAAEAERSFQKGAILVVDDEEAVRRVAKSALENYGYRVLTAANGRDAVEIFRDMPRSINAILLDVTMPVMSGREALPALRAIRGDVPIVLVSGYSETEIMPILAEDGATGFLQKPFTSAQLRGKLDAAIAASPVRIV